MTKTSIGSVPYNVLLASEGLPGPREEGAATT